MKKLSLLVIMLCLISCSGKPGDHDLRVAAKKFIRKELTSPSTATFAPDNEIKMIREKDGNTFYVYIYADTQNLSGTVGRKIWNLHLLYKGGSLSNIKNWEVIP